MGIQGALTLDPSVLLIIGVLSVGLIGLALGYLLRK